MRLLRITLLLLITVALSWLGSLGRVKPAQAVLGLNKATNGSTLLAPVWGPAIKQWSTPIGVLAADYGLDPDFIAAVIFEESHGDPTVVSRAGAVGLMGVMPSGPGMEWRPSTEELQDPIVNLRWGVAILTDIIRQSGGDFYAALTAYSGGWRESNSRVPREYAARVLNNYGRAVVSRNGISPRIASQWTLAIEMRRGHVPNESLLVLGSQPVSGLHTYGEHTIYDYVDASGHAYYVRGYAVPVAIVVPLNANAVSFGDSNALEPELQARLDGIAAKVNNSNPRVLIACLPSLTRLRGHVSTRWFAPSNCPAWHR